MDVLYALSWFIFTRLKEPMGHYRFCCSMVLCDPGLILLFQHEDSKDFPTCNGLKLRVMTENMHQVLVTLKPSGDYSCLTALLPI